jgi:hypothetical protein
MVPIVQFNVACTTQAEADKLLAQITQYLKSRKHRTRSELKSRYEMDSGFVEASASVVFERRDEAEQAYAWICANGGAYAANGGSASFHVCPEENPPADWLGCSDDPRAEYQEVKFAGSL